MEPEDQLDLIAHELASIEGSFHLVRGDFGQTFEELRAELKARVTALATEAKMLIDGEFGQKNDLTGHISTASNTKAQVMTTREMIQTAAKTLRRRKAERPIAKHVLTPQGPVPRGDYHTAEVCENGHISTNYADVYPQRRQTFCSKCGAKTLTSCPACRATIRGELESDVVIISTTPPTPPAYCHNCGKPFPWTESKIANAIELLEMGETLSPEEISQARTDLPDLTRDTPRTQVASFRFKKLLAKAGESIASGVRDIIVDVLSEAAKKAIFPPG